MDFGFSLVVMPRYRFIQNRIVTVPFRMLVEPDISEAAPDTELHIVEIQLETDSAETKKALVTRSDEGLKH